MQDEELAQRLDEEEQMLFVALQAGDANVARILQEEEAKMMEAWQKFQLGETKTFPQEIFRKTQFTVKACAQVEEKSQTKVSEVSETSKVSEIMQAIEQNASRPKKKAIQCLSKKK
jgi:hypothetical protein